MDEMERLIADKVAYAAGTLILLLVHACVRA